MFCHKQISASCQHVVLNPCSCIACPSCLLAAHGRRGSCPLDCPCGRGTVVSHQIEEEECVEYAQCEIKDLAKRRLVNTDNLGLRFVNSRPGSEIIYLSCFSYQKGTWDESRETWLADGISTSFVDRGISLIRDEEEGERQKASAMMCEFFAFLHPRVVVPSMTPRWKVPTLMPREFFQHAVDNYSLLMACLFGLTTGKSRRETEKISGVDFQDYQSQYLAVAAARDIILRCTSGYPLHFQMMLADQLGMQQVSKLFKELLSAFRITISRMCSGRRTGKAVVKHLLKEVKVRSYDLHILNGDNFGFKKKRNDPTYVQFIGFMDKICRRK